MFRRPGALSYAAVLRTPEVPRPFTAGTLARLSYGTVALSLLFAVQTAIASFGTAGVALAGSGLPAVLLPLKSRAVDRYGRRRVLFPLGISYALVLGLIVAAAAAGVQAAVAYLALSVAAGLLTPPVGPIMRGIWAALTPDPTARQRAYAMDAVVEETIFAVSPLIVGVVIATTEALVALGATAVLALPGTLGLATTSLPSRPYPAAPPAVAQLSARCSHRSCAGCAWSCSLSDLGSAPRAGRGRPRYAGGTSAAAGYLLAALSVGSAAGGLLWGRNQHRHSYACQLLALLVALAAGTLVPGVAPNLRVLAAVLAATGFAIAPIFVVAYLAADQSAGPIMRTEATTWVATASNLVGSAGAASAGFLVDQTSPTTTLLLTGASLTMSALALAVPQGRNRGQNSERTRHDTQ